MVAVQPPSPLERALTADERRAVTLIAESEDGFPEAFMLMHGFTGKLLAGLVRVGFVTCKAERMRIGRRVAYVPRLHITDKGRQAL